MFIESINIFIDSINNIIGSIQYKYSWSIHNSVLMDCSKIVHGIDTEVKNSKKDKILPFLNHRKAIFQGFSLHVGVHITKT